MLDSGYFFFGRTNYIEFFKNGLNMKEIVKLITVIRDSNKDAVYLYTHGECYNFALILKSMFDGEIWYSNIEGHVYFKHDDGYYDINGRNFNPPKDICKLDHDRPHKPHRWSKEARKVHSLIKHTSDFDFNFIENNKLL